MTDIPRTKELFDLGHTIARGLLLDTNYPHEAIPRLKDFITELSRCLDSDYEELDEGVFVAKDAVINDGAEIIGPTIICKGATIRHGAFIRGSVIVGEGAVIGNSSEIKNSIILDEAKLPHYNYVGDSVIGYRAHMGAGAIASNTRLDKRSIIISSKEKKIDTGLKKLGVMLGDYAEIGCGTILSPGTVVGRESIIHPLTHITGVIPEGCTVKGEIRRYFDQ